MKSLIPWKKQKREMANLRRDFDDWMGRFFNEDPAFFSSAGASRHA